MNLKLKSSKSSKSSNSKSSKFKSTKRYRRRKVRENNKNKNKHGIDKNSNHRVTQKVWRLEKDRDPREKQQQQQQQQQYQEKDKNMHSMTSRRQQGHGHGKDDITKVKTLQDATLKASRLYGMMRDFINNMNINIPSKINYRKIHSKWRNVKKQVQVGGVDQKPGTDAESVFVPRTVAVSPKAGTEAVPVDDKDCVELPPKLSLHVTAHPDDPKKFIVKRLPGDPLIHGSLTTFAEGLMGHLDKMKTGTEFDMGDEDILALIAHDLILLILGILGGNDDDDDGDDDDGGEERRRLLAAAIDAESRNAAAAAIIIALIGLIKEKDGDDGSSSSGSSSFGSSVDADLDVDQHFRDEIEGLGTEMRALISQLNALRKNNDSLRRWLADANDIIQQQNEINQQLWGHVQTLNDQYTQYEERIQRFQTINQQLASQNQQLNDALTEFQNRNTELLRANEELRGEVERLRQQLNTSQQQNANLEQTLSEQQAHIQQLEDASRTKDTQIDVLQHDLDARTAVVQQLENQMKQLRVDAAAGDDASRKALAAREAELAQARKVLEAAQERIQALQFADREKGARIGELENDIRDRENTVQQLGYEMTRLQADLERGKGTQEELAKKQHELTQAQGELEAAQIRVRELDTESAAQQDRIVALNAAHNATKSQLDVATEALGKLQSEFKLLSNTSSNERDQLRAEIATRQQQVFELNQKSKEEIAQLRQANADKHTELEAQKATSDELRRKIDDQLRLAQHLNKEKERINQDSILAVRQKDDEIKELKRQLQYARAAAAEAAAAAAASRSVPPPEVDNNSKLLELQASLRESLGLAAEKATENLEEIFPGNTSRIQQRRACVRETTKRINTLIDELTTFDADGTVEKPTEKVKTINEQIRLMREMCKSKLRTFIVQRGGGKDHAKSFTKVDGSPVIKSTTKLYLPAWGPFTGVYDEQSANEDKFEGVKPLIEGVPHGKVVVIFGYGYSGSGKTYTLFGDSSRGVDGIAQRAIEYYIQSGTTVCLREIYELYNDTYQASSSGGGPGENEFYYEKPTTPEGYSSLFIKTPGNEDCTPVRNKNEFNVILKKVETERLKNGHIFPTHNNPQSSRGHLFVELKVQRAQETPGYLVICDMGGRENPNEMWQNPSYKYCSSPLTVTGEPDIPGPIVRNKPGYYYKFPDLSGTHTMIKDMTQLQFDTSLKKGATVEIVGLTGNTNLNGQKGTLSDYSESTGRWEVKSSGNVTHHLKSENLKLILIPLRCPDKKVPVTTYQAVTGSKSDTHTGLSSILQVSQPQGRYKSAAYIMKTLREAFYINDSINHLLYHFEYYGKPQQSHPKKRDSNWDTGKDVLERVRAARDTGEVIPATRLYYPDIYVTIPQRKNKQEEHDGQEYTGETIGMRKILKKYDELAGNPDKIRYCTFACIRSEREFEDDSISTLTFASQVNSCGDVNCDATVCRGVARGGLGGGAKTRRNRSQGKIRTQRRRRQIVKPKSHPVTVVTTTQRRNMRDKKKGHRTRKMK